MLEEYQKLEEKISGRDIKKAAKKIEKLYQQRADLEQDALNIIDKVFNDSSIAQNALRAELKKIDIPEYERENLEDLMDY